MDTQLIYLTLAYLMGYRLLVVLVGGLCIFLGYRLFNKAVPDVNTAQGAELSASFGDRGSLTMKNAAPGSLFALFGAAIIIMVLAGSPPEISFKTENMALETRQAETNQVVVSKSAETDKPATRGAAPTAPTKTEVTLRGNENEGLPDTAEEAIKQAGQLFSRMQALVKHAIELAPSDKPLTKATYLQMQAELMFMDGEYSDALTQQQKVLQLVPTNAKAQKELACYEAITAH